MFIPLNLTIPKENLRTYLFYEGWCFNILKTIHPPPPHTHLFNVKYILQGITPLSWLIYQDEAEDREGEDGQGAGDGDQEGVPLVPVQEVQGEAINKESFQVGFVYNRRHLIFFTVKSFKWVWGGYATF